MSANSDISRPRGDSRTWRYKFEELRVAVEELHRRLNALGVVNPRPPGWQNNLIQSAKKLLARTFHWYARPFIEYDTAVDRSLQEIERSLEDVAAYTHALDWRLRQLEEASRESRAANVQSRTELGRVAENFRTAYVIGLFGSGRQYVVGLILENAGERAKYFRDVIRVHPGPTPMIYSGHATIKRVSRAQHVPEETSRILESVKAGSADLIFVYRHPLDSLLSNWVWWRTYIRKGRAISGISEVFANTDELCAYLEQHFADFRAFAEGDPSFFASLPGARFLSLAEFVEETELYLTAATLALRFEDFVVDPGKQFSKIAEVMEIPHGLSPLGLNPPKSKPYGYLAVKEKVAAFRDFVNELDAATKEGIQRLGYKLGT